MDCNNITHEHLAVGLNLNTLNKEPIPSNIDVLSSPLSLYSNSILPPKISMSHRGMSGRDTECDGP